MRRAALRAATPWYTEFDLPPGQVDERVNLCVSAGPGSVSLHALSSVTNNETQQVTTVTPDGHGGVPCTPCDVK